jgi:hypothetical protein
MSQPLPANIAPDALQIICALSQQHRRRCVVGRYVPEKFTGVDQAAAKVEREIREFVRRGAGCSRPQRTEEMDADGVQCIENAIQRVEEIDRVILELRCVRDVLRREGEQVNRDLAGYASLNQHLMTGMKIIAENLKQWKGASVRRATP